MAFRKPSEVARLCVLALAAGWLLHPFATGSRYGGGDAVWYAHMLADYVTQVRMGYFPVFAGQTEFAFNGAVYPLRVAPLYQHLAGLLDVATFHFLGIFALQHLAVIVSGVVGVFATYFCLCWVAPARRWAAVAFSVLYLSCPGVLATVYSQDLYMTWMTVALAPFAVYGIVRTFRHDDFRSQLVLGASQAALWWAHSPIALWFALIAAASQVARIAAAGVTMGRSARCCAGAAVFLLLAQYPFVSVAMIASPGGPSAASVPLDHPGLIVDNIRAAFPGAFLPIGSDVSGLGALQLGYGYLAVLVAATAAAIVARRLELAVLLGAADLLLLLLLPIPGLNRLLWSLVPGSVLRITYYWPMQRFYLILAALLAAAGQMTFDGWGPARRSYRMTAGILLAGCCTWSVLQAGRFVGSAKARTASAAESARSLRPENLLLMDHAYGLFSGLPPHFSNGVVDPRSEARILPAAVGATGRVISAGTLQGKVDANPGILDLDPTFRLEPGRRYQLRIKFSHPATPGVLQCVGSTMLREYLLPSSGESLSFGSGATNSPHVDLWTTNPAGDRVTLRFIPTQPGSGVARLAAFGSFELREILPAEEPVEVTSLVPFSARVRAASAAVLETPRVYMPGYVALVDGRTVTPIRSPDFLVGIPVPAGEHTAVLAYHGPRLLRASYWLGLVAWAGALWILVRPPGRIRS